MSAPIGPYGARYNSEGERVRLDGDRYAEKLRPVPPPRLGKLTFCPSKYERREGRAARSFVCLDARGRGVKWSELQRAVERGWKHFWSRPKRVHLTPPEGAAYLIKHYYADHRN